MFREKPHTLNEVNSIMREKFSGRSDAEEFDEDNTPFKYPGRVPIFRKRGEYIVKYLGTEATQRPRKVVYIYTYK